MKRRILQALILLTIVIFFVLAFYKKWDEIKGYHWDFNYIYLFSSLLSLGIFLFLLSCMWNLLLTKLGEKLSLGECIRIWFFSQVCKYVPGKIWSILGRVYLCEQKGLSRTKSSISVFLESGLLVLSGLVLSALLFIYEQNVLLLNRGVFYFLLIPFGLVFIHPRIIEKSINYIFRAFKREEVRIYLHYNQILGLFTAYSSILVIYGLSNYLLINSVTSLSLSKLPVITGMFILSWVVGIISFLTPAGIGVREGVLSLLLSLYMPLPIAILISLLARACWMFADFFIITILSILPLMKKGLVYSKKRAAE